MIEANVNATIQRIEEETAALGQLKLVLIRYVEARDTIDPIPLTTEMRQRALQTFDNRWDALVLTRSSLDEAKDATEPIEEE